MGPKSADENVAKQQPVGRGAYLALTAALLGWMFDGAEMGVFSLVSRPAIKDLVGQQSEQEITQWIGVITGLFLVGAATGGVWKTTNGGTSWTPLTDNACGLAMGSVAIDPVNPQIIYAGTGEENFSSDSYQGCGVLRSTDGGANWTQLGAATFINASGSASRIARIVIDVASAGSTSSTILLVASQTGLWKSDNSGATWALALAGTITDLIADPTTAGTYTAAIGAVGGGTSNGIYRTTDFGANWTKLSGGLPTTSVGRVNLGMSASAPNIIYASVQATSSTTLLGIWKTLDGEIGRAHV